MSKKGNFLKFQKKKIMYLENFFLYQEKKRSSKNSYYIQSYDLFSPVLRSNKARFDDNSGYNRKFSTIFFFPDREKNSLSKKNFFFLKLRFFCLFWASILLKISIFEITFFTETTLSEIFSEFCSP